MIIALYYTKSNKEFFDMIRYPIHFEIKGCIHTDTATNMINQAFYDGFLLSMLDTKDDYDSLRPIDRIKACALALCCYEKIFGETPENLKK